MRIRTVVAITTGVSRTTVASRPSAHRDRRRGREHQRQQAPRPPARAADHQGPDGVEQALAPTAFGDQQERRQEADGRRQSIDRVLGGREPDRADQDQRRRAGDSGHGLRQPRRPGHRRPQGDRERQQ